MKPMTIKEVCEYLNIGRTTFYKYKELGMPVHSVPNCRPYCYKKEIDEWIKYKEE